MTGYKVVLECESVKGYCPFYKKGDKVSFIEPGIVMEETDAICFAAVLTFAPFYRPLIRGIPPEQLGLSSKMITCHAPPITRPEAHGTVFFKVNQIPVEETLEDQWMKDLQKKGVLGTEEVIKRIYWPEDADHP